MALFFDQAWFDDRLAATGTTRADLARLLRLTEEQLGEVWKDQRELAAGDVAAIARFLNVSAADVALRAGVSTPLPSQGTSADERLSRLEVRVAELEQEVQAMRALLARHGLK